MDQDSKKKAAAKAAIEIIELEGFIGVGTGSTANYFIDFLAEHKHQIEGAVASSEASAERLRANGIAVMELNGVGDLAVYVDGADEATHHRHLIKGGGGALTRLELLDQLTDRSGAAQCARGVGSLGVEGQAGHPGPDRRSTQSHPDHRKSVHRSRPSCRHVPTPV